MPEEPATPILLYHKVGQPPRGARVPGQHVSARLFRRHMAYLEAQGYRSVPLVDVAMGERPLPSRPVVITFDDGYRCVYEEAYPALREYGFAATVFLVAGAVGGTNGWEQVVGDVEEPLLGARELEAMREGGIEFGSHTLSHPHLTDLSATEARSEIEGSRRRVEDLVGGACRTFAYPYGEWDARVRELVVEAGYEAACTTRRAAARATDDPFALPRISVRRYTVVPRFAYRLWRALRARP